MNMLRLFGFEIVFFFLVFGFAGIFFLDSYFISPLSHLTIKSYIANVETFVQPNLNPRKSP